MKNMLKDAAILLIITVMAGFVLGYVYDITKEPIARAEEAAAREAYAEVFAGAADFTVVQEGMPKDAAFLAAWAESGFEGVTINNVLNATDDGGNVIGYVLTVTSHEGYGGDITFTMGISADGTLNGISILSIAETPGLGMNAETVLKPQFAGKKVPGFTVVKTGAETETQIDAISGATVTSKAVTTAVNGGLYYFQTQLGGGSYEAK